MTDTRVDGVGRLLGLVVHDLRNPVAAIAANVGYLRTHLRLAGPDVHDCLNDVAIALADLQRGLEQVAWIGHWLAAEPIVGRADADVCDVLRTLVPPAELDVRVELPSESPLRARGAASCPAIVDVLLANARDHGRGRPVQVTVRADDEAVEVLVTDEGPPIGADFRERAMQLEGQIEAKRRPDGRYGRVAGLFAARLLAEACGATLRAEEDAGRSRFVLRYPRVRES
ncbi:MAG: HAMP domain-containing sensor histidine kinase [Myxococcales bacterium]|nr:HAMP domain-containing sensor histidine kinase [Myxococcales bacterium]